MNLFSRISSILKGHFFSGLFIVIPLAVIGWIALWVFDFLWQLQLLIPAPLRPENFIPNEGAVQLVNFLLTVAAALALAFFISFLGWSSKHFIGKKVLEWIGEVIQRIPVIRSIYSALDQLLRTIASGGGKQFSRVVYVEYPRKGTWVIAFVTAPARGFQGGSDPNQHYLNLYIPTTPNPTSGFHLIVAESEVRDSNMKVEEAFKTLLSLGIAQAEGGRGES